MFFNPLTINERDWIYLIYGEQIISEGELIINHPTRTIKSSFLKKYIDVCVSGENASFIEICVKVNKIEASKVKLSGPIINPISEHFIKQCEKRKIRVKKRELYERGRIITIQIQKELRFEKAPDRHQVLDVAYFLIEKLIKELKRDLIEE